MSKYDIIHEINRLYSISITTLCKHYKIKHSTYYAHIKSKKVNSDKLALEQKIVIFCRDLLSKPHTRGLGYRMLRIKVSKKYPEFDITDKKMYRICQKYNLKSIIRKRPKYVKDKETRKRPNILNQDFIALAPYQKIVLDTTYLRVFGKKFYLCVAMDLFNREILGYKLSKSPNTQSALSCLSSALSKTNGALNILIHSDQGSQFTADKFGNYVEVENKHIFSNSRVGNCWDNAMVENFFSIFKTEFFYLTKITSESELHYKIEQYIHYYNNCREQLKTEKTPLELRVEYFANLNQVD